MVVGVVNSKTVEARERDCKRKEYHSDTRWSWENGEWKMGRRAPWELWELILGNLSTVDRLSCVTSTKVMMERYEKGSDLATLREEAREEV